MSARSQDRSGVSWPDIESLHTFFQQKGYTPEQALCIAVVWVGCLVGYMQTMRGWSGKEMLQALTETMEEAFDAKDQNKFRFH